jgi:hypothetical protein
MTYQAIESVRGGTVADMLVAMVSTDGTASHAYPRSPALAEARDATRNLADAAHWLCVLHGRHPGVIHHPATRTAHAGASGWLSAAADAFAQERALLTRLAVATGPQPSTPGQAVSEAAILQQRHALDTLARSERHGCALGAAFALALDWQAVRTVLDTAARRAMIDLPPLALPSEEETRIVALAFAESPALERALSFGAQQVLAQHRGFWDLLESRHAARERL